MSAILSQLKRNSKLQLDCQRCKKVALRDLVWLNLLVIALDAYSVFALLCVSSIVEIRMDLTISLQYMAKLSGQMIIVLS